RDDFVARADAEAHERHEERVGSRGNAERVPDAERLRQGLLEGFVGGPEHEASAREDLGDASGDLALEGGVVPGQIEQRDGRRCGTHGRIVSAGPDFPRRAAGATGVYEM